MEPLISVIIPVYNVERFLNRCLESVVNQTYKNLEILLIDDGSPDNCPVICDKWAVTDERIRVYHKKNGGLSDARNYGMKYAKGQYFAFVDSDDFIEKDMYEKMIHAILENDCKLACCGRYYYKEGKATPAFVQNSVKVYSDVEAFQELLDNGMIEEAAWDKLYARELWKGLEYPIGEVNEDIVVAPEIIRRSGRIVHIGDPKYYYCYNGNSITKSDYKERNIVMLRHIDELRNYVQKNYPSLEHKVKVIEAKYAMNTMISILISVGGVKKNRNHYKEYKKRLKKSYAELVRSKNFSKKKKAEAFLLLVGMYAPVWKIMKIVKKR